MTSGLSKTFDLSLKLYLQPQRCHYAATGIKNNMAQAYNCVSTAGIFAYIGAKTSHTTSQ
jgi:hypothetical protein